MVVAALSEPLLNALDVTPATFQVAAAIVLGLPSARWLLAGARTIADDTPAAGWGRVAVPLLFPVLITPQLVTVSVSVGAVDGAALVAAGAMAGLVLAWAAASVAKQRRPAWDAGLRLVAAFGMALALALAVDGVKTI
ncbi:MAG: hypothetical protein H0U21_00765 [Acidimicrobiia bacterium]|nr:hypothetical protein [Acidimicrobiia bacterium]